VLTTEKPSTAAPKVVSVSVSLTSPAAGFEEVGRFTLKQTGGDQSLPIQRRARFVKLRILENFGMTWLNSLGEVQRSHSSPRRCAKDVLDETAAGCRYGDWMRTVCGPAGSMGKDSGVACPRPCVGEAASWDDSSEHPSGPSKRMQRSVPRSWDQIVDTFRCAGERAWPVCDLPRSGLVQRALCRLRTLDASDPLSSAESTRAKDEMQMEYRVSTPAGTTELGPKRDKLKAKVDGEDLLTPLVEKAAETIVGSLVKK
jgi:hypothetical protein